jgi:hypothetical protein
LKLRQNKINLSYEMQWHLYAAKKNEMANKQTKYKSLSLARKYAKSLHLSSRYDWVILINTKGALPKDVPSNPDEIYDDWKNWKHFLGFKNKVRFLSFTEARNFVRSLKLNGLKSWKAYCNWDPNDVGLKPANIPSSPHINYKADGWKGYSDFLGSQNSSFNSKTFREFSSARKYCRALGLTSSGQWLDYCKEKIDGLLAKPDDIPSNIARQYTDKGFDGMNDFLNTAYHRKIARTEANRTFDEAKRFVHSLKLKNLIQWNLYIKGELPHRKRMPKDIPTNPMLVYKENGWAGYGDWLGTYNIPPFQMEFRNFESARKFVRKLGLISSTEWIAYCKGDYSKLPEKPDDIPHSVARHYQDTGWLSYKDFLMDEKKQETYSKFLPYEEAKAFVNKLQLKNVMQWQRYLKGQFPELPKKPKNIPSNPTSIYQADGWIGMGDWLDNGAFPYANKDYMSFKEAKSFVRSLGLVTSQEWVAYCQGEMTNLPEKPMGIPANVVKQYEKKGWKGFKDFLDTKKNRGILKESLPYDDARSISRSLGIKSGEEWLDFCKGKLKKKYGSRPKNIPVHPEVVYLRDGWKGIKDWLKIK